MCFMRFRAFMPGNIAVQKIRPVQTMVSESQGIGGFWVVSRVGFLKTLGEKDRYFI